VPKEDNGPVLTSISDEGRGKIVVRIIQRKGCAKPFTEKCAGFDSPPVFCW